MIENSHLFKAGGPWLGSWFGSNVFEIDASQVACDLKRAQVKSKQNHFGSRRAGAKALADLPSLELPSCFPKCGLTDSVFSV